MSESRRYVYYNFVWMYWRRGIKILFENRIVIAIWKKIQLCSQNLLCSTRTQNRMAWASNRPGMHSEIISGCRVNRVEVSRKVVVPVIRVQSKHLGRFLEATLSPGGAGRLPPYILTHTSWGFWQRRPIKRPVTSLTDTVSEGKDKLADSKYKRRETGFLQKTCRNRNRQKRKN